MSALLISFRELEQAHCLSLIIRKEMDLSYVSELPS